MKTLIVSVAIQQKNSYYDYLKTSKNLINSYLEFTNFDILILTNDIDFYKKTYNLNNKRLIFIDYHTNFSESIISGNKFNMHIKRHAIRYGSELNYDIIYHHDADCYITGWDQLSYEELIKKDYDIIFPTTEIPQLGVLRKKYKHIEDKIQNEYGDLYYDDLDQSPNPAETRIIFKNNNKLKKFLDFWDKISDNNNNYFTYFVGVYIGTSALHAKMKMFSVKREMKFSKYCRITHGGKILDYHGQILENES